MQRAEKVQQSLDDPATPDREWVAGALNKVAKLGIANNARLLMDNQKTLNATNASDRSHRQLHSRIQEWEFDRFKRRSGEGNGSDEMAKGEINKDGIAMSEDEEMQINIDSPTTIHYRIPPPEKDPPPPPPPEKSNGWAKPLVAAALIGLPIAAAGITYALMNQADKPPAVTANPDYIGGTELLPPLGRKTSPNNGE